MAIKDFVEVIINNVKRAINIKSGDNVNIKINGNKTHIHASNGSVAAGGDIMINGSGVFVDGDKVCGNVIYGDKIVNNNTSSTSKKKNSISINGETFEINGTDITVTINGNIGDLKLNVGNVIINGNVEGDVNLTTGDLEVKGSIKGNVEVMTGDTRANIINGSVETQCGDIRVNK